MLRKVSYCIIPLLFFIIWIIMNDGLTLFNIICGVVVVAVSLCLSSYLLGFNYIKVFHLPVLAFLKYMFFLLVKIYASGISATFMIITGKINPGFVKHSVDKRIKNVYLHNIIASSITLTPGTITVDNNEGELTVLALHADDSDVGVVFEASLLEIEGMLENQKQ